MKKLIALSLIIVALLSCLVSCDTDPERKEYSYETFYGVVKYSKIINGPIVYIPKYGEVKIPENEGCCTCFDGHEPNEDYSYRLRPGDLIAINFKYEKAWDDHGVSVMETYPAVFDRKADIIEVKKQNIDFDKNDNGYVFSFPSTEEIDSASVGDTLYFIYYEGKNGSEKMIKYATGTLIERSDSIFTVALSIHEDEDSFLEKYCSMSVKLSYD